MIEPSSNTLSRSRIVVLAIGLTIALLPLSGVAQVPGENAQQQPTADAASGTAMPSLWDLAVQGGWFMIPIGIASIVTIAFTLERIVGLRRHRILPKPLIGQLRGQMADTNLDPRKLWEATEEHPSPLANLVRAAILKTGRPHAEVEKAVEDAVQRETADMTRNMRPINVVASISPLLGLLGTVQGMILAFMVTSTTSSTGTAKAQELAHGIYTALVTTFAGLTVAVVSVVLANFLEGRIERLLQQMEGIFLDLLPHLERYEGRVRISEASVEDGGIRVRQTQPATTEKSVSAKHESDKSGSHAAPKAPRPQKTKRSPDKPPKGTSKPAVVAESTSEQKPVPSSGSKTLRGHFDG